MAEKRQQLRKEPMEATESMVALKNKKGQSKLPWQALTLVLLILTFTVLMFIFMFVLPFTGGHSIEITVMQEKRATVYNPLLTLLQGRTADGLPFSQFIADAVISDAGGGDVSEEIVFLNNSLDELIPDGNYSFYAEYEGNIYLEFKVSDPPDNIEKYIREYDLPAEGGGTIKVALGVWESEE